MRIGIEVNGVLRNTLGKIEQTYQKFMIDKTEGIEYEDDFKYEINYPIENLEIKKHFNFKDDDEMYSFLYEEFPMTVGDLVLKRIVSSKAEISHLVLLPFVSNTPFDTSNFLSTCLLSDVIKTS